MRTTNMNFSQPMPSADQSARWKYQAIYRQGNDRVGQWSDVVSIAVEDTNK